MFPRGTERLDALAVGGAVVVWPHEPGRAPAAAARMARELATELDRLARILEPRPGGQCCRTCRAPVGLVVGTEGQAAVVDPPAFDPDRGWICPVHFCPAGLERVRRELDADAERSQA